MKNEDAKQAMSPLIPSKTPYYNTTTTTTTNIFRTNTNMSSNSARPRAAFDTCSCHNSTVTVRTELADNVLSISPRPTETTTTTTCLLYTSPSPRD